MGSRSETDSMGRPSQSWDQDDTIMSDIALSILVPRGSFFQDPSFGLPELPGKLTPRNVELARERVREALQWLLDTGRAKSMEIEVERDADADDRLNIRVVAVQADGREVTFGTFVEVI